jgi:hypothetical protein
VIPETLVVFSELMWLITREDLLSKEIIPVEIERDFTFLIITIIIFGRKYQKLMTVTHILLQKYKQFSQKTNKHIIK